MPYHIKLVERIKKQPMSNLGAKLGRWAVFHDLSVAKIATATGATRQSIYNWFSGGEVFVAYRPRVERLIQILESAKNADDAWRKVCSDFDLRT